MAEPHSLKTDIKVFLAVPEANLREILVYLLKAWEYNVVLIQEGQDMAELARQENPNLIIIDAAFEHKQGLKVCRRLKDDFLTSYIPTIVLIDKRQLRRDLLSIEQGVDDYLIKPPDPIDLEIRIVLALRSAAHHFNANALTKLPGNKLIEKELIQRMEAGQDFSFHYIDIDNFKSYNDKYGHLRGDRVIIETAQIISQCVKENGAAEDFVGHIGGDDFVVVTEPLRSENVASAVIDRFDARSGDFYTREDRQNGFIVACDRSGKVTNIPLMSLSIAIVNNTSDNPLNLLEITDIAAELKKYLKGQKGSNYMVNRRVLDKGMTGRKRDVRSEPLRH